MNNKTIAKFVVFLLVYVNAFLAQHKIKTIPVIDQSQVAVVLAFVYSAYEWVKHALKWVKTNWLKKQPVVSAVPEPVLPNPTPTAADVTLPAAPVATPTVEPQPEPIAPGPSEQAVSAEPVAPVQPEEPAPTANVQAPAPGPGPEQPQAHAQP